MESFFNNIYDYIIFIINNSSLYGPIIACLLIYLESLIPVLPLFVFITLIFISYGYVVGFLIAYILTCLGCITSFFLFRKLFKNYVDAKIRNKEAINKLMKIVDNISFTNLVLLIAIPFTPAFLINIACGLSKISFKKFFFSLIIGKISLVVFWGFIGTSLLESLKNPKILVIILLMLFLAFLLSKYISKKLDIK